VLYISIWGAWYFVWGG